MERSLVPEGPLTVSTVGALGLVVVVSSVVVVVGLAVVVVALAVVVVGLAVVEVGAAVVVEAAVVVTVVPPVVLSVAPVVVVIPEPAEVEVVEEVTTGVSAACTVVESFAAAGRVVEAAAEPSEGWPSSQAPTSSTAASKPAKTKRIQRTDLLPTGLGIGHLSDVAFVLLHMV